MRVGLNLLYIGAGVAGGGTYAEGLLTGLTQLPDENSYTIFARRDAILPTLPERFTIYRAPVSGTSNVGRMLWEYGRLPRVARDCDVFHGLGSLSPAPQRGKFVLTVHDLIYRHWPASVPWPTRQFMQWVSPRAIRRADRIITISQFVARQLIELDGVPESKITTIPLGPGQDFGAIPSADAIAEVRTRLKLDRRYVLSVARGYPHKNLAGLLKAFALVPGDDLLVLVGQPYRIGSEAAALAESLGIADRVRFTGFLSRADLHAVYRSASLFAFPSLDEGFGLPPLEAMHCGIPVVSSSAAAIPETVGNAGLLVDARNASEFADAMRQVLGDEKLAADLRTHGYAQVAKFDWTRMTEQTRAVYHDS